VSGEQMVCFGKFLKLGFK